MSLSLDVRLDAERAGVPDAVRPGPLAALIAPADAADTLRTNKNTF